MDFLHTVLHSKFFLGYMCGMIVNLSIWQICDFISNRKNKRDRQPIGFLQPQLKISKGFVHAIFSFLKKGR